MNWFARNGDKLFASITAVCSLLATQTANLPKIAPYAGYFTVLSSAATLLHMIWYPNATQGAPK
jgi:hypothetical protein